MDERMEKSLRALAGTAKGPFRIIAYGLGAEDAGERTRDLGSLLHEHAPEDESLVIVENADPYTAAVDRARFKTEVLGQFEAAAANERRVKEHAGPLEGRDAPARAREKLAALASSLPELLMTVDRKLAGAATPAEAQDAVDPLAAAAPEPEAPVAAAPRTPRDSDSWLLLVRGFEDLGSDAEAVASAAGRVFLAGAHLVIHEDGLDTRTREGRALAHYTLRLGMLKAERSRQRAVQDIARRRAGLRVYGPVPFGFTREGEELRPVPAQIDVVRRIRELARLSQTPVTIAVTLNREKHSWKDGSRWNWRRVSHILKNSIYDKVLAEAKR